jgi:hypothetical protein
LPEFALPLPELLTDLDLGLEFSIARSSESQSLTPFGTQQSQSSPNAGALGGLVLPSSSPVEQGGFQLEGDDEAAGNSGFFGGDDGFDLGEPDFGFDENGELIEGPLAPRVAGTPAARSGAAMHSNAGASAKVRKEHEEGRMVGAQVSLLLFWRVVWHLALTLLSFEMGCLASLALPACRHTTSHLRHEYPLHTPISTLSPHCLRDPSEPTFFFFFLDLSSSSHRTYLASTMATDIYQFPGDEMELDLPILGDDLPDVDGFPTSVQDPSSDPVEVVQSLSASSAPMRKKRAPRVLPVDMRMELRNKELAEWNKNYLRNMDAVIKNKKKARVAQQAKKDADYYVWGRGIGGMAEHFAGVTGPNPFEMFIGDNLFELATGVSRKKVTGTKHDRDSGIDDATQEESRRVRQKTGEPDSEVARGQDEEGFFMPGGDEVEMPRDAPPALDDQQILPSMPWNTGSKRGSSAIPRSGRPGSQPGSRLVSASPLHGRGQPLDLGALGILESDADAEFAMAGDEFVNAGLSSSPTVIPSSKKPSNRVNEALDAEGNNFLDFVTDAIVEKRNRAQAALGHMSGPQDVQAATEIDVITFDELLPPVENNRMIACQGLMMVLSLGTKGMLDVQQPRDFSDINLKLTRQAKATRVVEISDGEDEDESYGGTEIVEERVIEDEDEEEEEDGQFEEQFAAGRAGYVEDDHDELYDD